MLFLIIDIAINYTGLQQKKSGLHLGSEYTFLMYFSTLNSNLFLVLLQHVRILK